WDLNRREQVGGFSLAPGDERVIGGGVFSTVDRRLAALNLGGNVVGVLDASPGKWGSPPLAFPQRISAFALSDDGHQLATGAGSRLELWDMPENRKLPPALVLQGPPYSLRFSPDGHWLACLVRGKLVLLNTVTGHRQAEIDDPDLEIAALDNDQ